MKDDIQEYLELRSEISELRQEISEKEKELKEYERAIYNIVVKCVEFFNEHKMLPNYVLRDYEDNIEGFLKGNHELDHLMSDPTFELKYNKHRTSTHSVDVWCYLRCGETLDRPWYITIPNMMLTDIDGYLNYMLKINNKFMDKYNEIKHERQI